MSHCRFDVVLLNKYTSVCCECGVVREHEQSFRLFQLEEIPLKWTYIAVSRDEICEA